MRYLLIISSLSRASQETKSLRRDGMEWGKMQGFKGRGWGKIGWGKVERHWDRWDGTGWEETVSVV